MPLPAAGVTDGKAGPGRELPECGGDVPLAFAIEGGLPSVIDEHQRRAPGTRAVPLHRAGRYPPRADSGGWKIYDHGHLTHLHVIGR